MSYPVFYVPAGDVLPVMFSSYSGSTGASVTLTGLAVTDIEIYKDGGVTQRASDAGYTLLDTDGIDFDAITGIHGFSIDTGDNTDAGFYTVGAWFTVVVSAVTIDSQTVSFIACQFRLMAAESIAAKPKVDVDGWLGTACATPTTNGVPEVDLTHIAGSAVDTTAAQLGVNVVNWKGSAAPAMTGDAFARLGAPAGASVSADIAAIQADTDNIQTRLPTVLISGTADSGTTTTMVDAARTEANNDHWRGQVLVITSGTNQGLGRLITAFTAATDTITVSPAFPVAVGTDTYEIWPASDTILAQLTHTSAIIPTVSTLTGHTAQTGDCFARLGAPAGASVSADIAAVKSDTAAILVDTGTDGVALANGAISSAKFAAGAVDAAALATDAGQEIADAILLRKLDRSGTGTDATDERTVVNALRALRNKASIAAGTLTVTKENDITTAWTAAVTTAAGNPLSAIDPT